MEDIKKAIEVLKYHQEWRKGAEIPQTDVKELTNALDITIDILSKWEESERWRKVEEELPEQNKTVLVKDSGGYLFTAHISIHGWVNNERSEYVTHRKIIEWKPIH